MATFDSINTLKDNLVRKALNGNFIVAPISADPITVLTETSAATLKALPTGYIPGGLTTDEGLRFARATETSAVTAWQRNTPVREDKTSDVTTLQVDFEELSRITIALYTGVALSSLTPDATTGELSIPKPATPTDVYWRGLAIARDSAPGGDVYVAKFFPRCKVTNYSDQAWGKGDNAINWGMTFTSYVDPALGYSQRDIFGGPGWKALLTDAGFSA